MFMLRPLFIVLLSTVAHISSASPCRPHSYNTQADGFAADGYAAYGASSRASTLPSKSKFFVPVSSITRGIDPHTANRYSTTHARSSSFLSPYLSPVSSLTTSISRFAAQGSSNTQPTSAVASASSSSSSSGSFSSPASSSSSSLFTGSSLVPQSSSSATSPSSEASSSSSSIAQSSSSASAVSSSTSITSVSSSVTSLSSSSILSSTTSSDVPPPIQTCELGTAFGYQESDSVTLNTQPGNGCNRWGWYETPTLAELQAGISGILYVGAGGNNLNNAIDVGDWTAVASTAGGVTITYSLNAGYFLDEVHIDLDCLPIDTCAPGQYTFNSGALPNLPVYANPTPVQYPVCSGGSAAYLILQGSVNFLTTAEICAPPVAT